SAYQLECVPNAERVLHYGAGAPEGAVEVPAVLFPDCVRVDSKGIHPVSAALARALDTAPGLRPPPASPRANGTLAYDAIGLVFLLLSRLEERDHPLRDSYGRFPLAAALFPAE